MQTVDVPLDGRAYRIEIDSGLLRKSELFRSHLGRRAAIVTNDVVAPLYLQRLEASLAMAGVESFAVILPDGEKHKTWESLNLIFDALLKHKCERSTPLIALGGGVVGDMTGFAAACYQRGAPFIQVPTTLLAQVDSSVGGKTAINHPLGKNMIGAFHQPKHVVIDTETLSTLPNREFSAGLAEVIKYGLIRDRDFFAWIENNLSLVLARDEASLVELVCRSCKNKAEVVVADETEQGERALLNLGHTFGHAIETGMGYGEWLHGEAVSAGTMMAAQLSFELGWLSSYDFKRIEDLYIRAGLPTFGPARLLPDAYLELMAHDKKVKDGRIRLILLRSIGCAEIIADVDSGLVLRSIEKRTASN